jgi:hypothetical protein
MQAQFYWLKWYLVNFLPGLSSNLNPPDLYLTGIRGMSHFTLLKHWSFHISLSE